MKCWPMRLGAVAALSVVACGDGGGGGAATTAPEPVTPPPPAQPAAVVSFVEDAVTVAEGEVANIEIRYQATRLAGPLRLMVSPRDGNTVPADYEFSATSIEIPAGQEISGTKALSLTALADREIDEGHEVLSLRLVLPRRNAGATGSGPRSNDRRCRGHSVHWCSGPGNAGHAAGRRSALGHHVSHRVAGRRCARDVVRLGRAVWSRRRVRR